MKYLKQITYVFVLVGALNWGLYGVSGFDLVEVIFGSVPMIARIVYVLVGLSALYIIVGRFTLCLCKGCCNTCSKEDCVDCGVCSIEEKK